MAHRLNIRTEGGRTDSLQRAVRIAFTLTPVESKRPTRPYDVLAFQCFSFDSNDDQTRWVEWDLDLGFGKYETLKSSGIRPYCCFKSGTSVCEVSPGQIVPLTSGPTSSETQWGRPKAYKDHVAFKQFSIMTANATDSEQRMALGTRVTRDYANGAKTKFEPIVAYHTLKRDGRIITPSDLMLQAYLVDDAVYYDGSILFPQDLARPLFPLPLKCDALPRHSIWRLFQDHNGTVRLETEDQTENRRDPVANEVLAKSLDDMALQLRRIQQSLKDSEERLSAFEAMNLKGLQAKIQEDQVMMAKDIVTHAKEGGASGEQVVAFHDPVFNYSAGLARRIVLVEAQEEVPTADSRLSAMEVSVEQTGQLPMVDSSATHTHGRMHEGTACHGSANAITTIQESTQCRLDSADPALPGIEPTSRAHLEIEKVTGKMKKPPGGTETAMETPYFNTIDKDLLFSSSQTKSCVPATEGDDPMEDQPALHQRSFDIEILQKMSNLAETLCRTQSQLVASESKVDDLAQALNEIKETYGRDPYLIQKETSEDDSVNRIDELFRHCKLVYQKTYPESAFNFDELDFTGRLKCEPWPLARGNFADVYQGDVEGSVVAVKSLRLPEYGPHNDDVYQSTLLRFFREMGCWSRLDHPNVARMLGFTLADGKIGLISHYYEHGNLVQYLQRNKAAHKPDIMLDVAEGVQYLHTCSSPLIHGDLKGVNVLINQNGMALLADFGLSKQVEDMKLQTGFTTFSGVTGTAQWMPPELLRGSSPSLASDIYSFGGVLLEICCPGKTPYHYMDSREKMTQAKLKGEPPERLHYPEMEDADELWRLLSACWKHDSINRPDATLAVEYLYAWFGLSPRVDQSIVARPPIICQICLVAAPPDQTDVQPPTTSSVLASASRWFSARCSIHHVLPPLADNTEDPRPLDATGLERRINEVSEELRGHLAAAEEQLITRLDKVQTIMESRTQHTREMLSRTRQEVRIVQQIATAGQRQTPTSNLLAERETGVLQAFVGEDRPVRTAARGRGGSRMTPQVSRGGGGGPRWSDPNVNRGRGQ